MVDRIRSMSAITQALVYEALNKATGLGATDIDLFMDLRGRHHIIGEYKHCPLGVIPPLRGLNTGQRLALTRRLRHCSFTPRWCKSALPRRS